MLKVKNGIMLRKMKDQSFAIPIGEALKDFSGMIRLNECGVYYWKKLEQGAEKEELLKDAEADFPEVSKETLAADLDEFLEKVMFSLEEI